MDVQANSLIEAGVAGTLAGSTGWVGVGLSAFTALVKSAIQNDENSAEQEFMHMLHSKVARIEARYLDETFFNKLEGRVLISKLLASARKDFRDAKIQAMVNLATNFMMKTKLTFDEKELFVYTLDSLNPLQLSILQVVVSNMILVNKKRHRGFGWELLVKDYEAKGISKSVMLQSIRVLESNGLVNQNSGVSHEVDQTHFITDFGEQFIEFCNSALSQDSSYLLQ